MASVCLSASLCRIRSDALLVLFAAVLALPAAASAQGNPQLAGNWEIDAAKSETGRGRAGETTVYKVDAPEHEVPGPLSWTSMAKSTWDKDRFVVNIARIIEGPTGPVRIEMKDVYHAAGDVLTIERTQGVQTWKSVFNRRQ